MSQGKTDEAREDAEQEPDESDPTLIARATETAQKVMGWFPVRVWQRFTARNGQILAAGASYQALFAIFAALYVAFAILGLWLGGNEQAINGLIDLINGYLPGVIGTSAGDGGIITAEQVTEVARGSAATLSITGAVALVIVFWTAVSWIGSVRTAVRDIFGLRAEVGNPILLQLRDLGAALGFAALLGIGAVLGWAGTAALDFVFALFHWPTDSFWFNLLGRIVAIAVMFAVDTITLVFLFRFLTGTALRTRDVLPGSLIGAAGVTVLQLAFGFLIGKAPSNPLLVTFAVLIGLLLWIRFVMMVILVAAAWVAESAESRDIEIEKVDDDERARREAELLVKAAEVDLQRAKTEAVGANVWRRWGARRAVAQAENVLTQRTADLESLSPEPAKR